MLAAVSRLRATIARLEGRPALAPGPAGRERGRVTAVTFEVEPLDRLFPHGVRAASLHEVAVRSVRDGGLAAGFVATLLGRIAAGDDAAVLWASEGRAIGESGALHGPGLVRLGLDPGRLLLVRAHAAADVLWALEAGLEVAGLAAVVGEIAGAPKVLDLTATRRLALRSERRGVPAFLVRIGGEEKAASAARTRWRIAPAASREAVGGETLLGWPAWRVELVRNRDGRCGAARVGFDAETGRFFALAAEEEVSARDTASQGREPRGREAAVVPFFRRAG